MAKIANKNLGIGREGAALGSSAVLTRFLHIKSVDIRPDEEKVVLDDTSTSVLGGLKYHKQKVTVEGSINAYATPESLFETLELVTGTSNAGVSFGGSTAVSATFSVNTGSYMSKWLRVDDGVGPSEDYHGVRAKTWKLDIGEDSSEITMDIIGQGYTSTGATIGASYYTSRPFTLGEFRLWQGATYTALGGSAMTELVVHDISLEYDNQMEGLHQSGQRTITRSDAKVPTLKLTFKRMYESTDLRDNAWGSSSYAYRLEARGTEAQGLIGGLSKAYFAIDIPQAQVTGKHDRNYAAGEIIVETIEMMAVYDPQAGYLWQPQVLVNR